MSPKFRMLWMQLHAYTACFFLAAAVLYAISGGLYLVGFEGEVSAEYEYVLDLENGWPEDQHLARDIAIEEMAQRGHFEKIPPDYYLWEGMHDWYGFKREVLMVPEEDGSISLHIHEHDFWKQLLLIHKGFAGPFLKVFSILWGFSLIFSQISGVILALNIPKIKRNSLICVGLGFAVLVAWFLMG